MRRTSLLVLGVVSGLAASAGGASVRGPARPRAHVEGAVLDGEGAGVAGATVVIRPAGLAATIAAAARTFALVTDRDGRFHLEGVPPGTYWFVAFGAGLATGVSEALPVGERLEVSIRVEDATARA